MLWRSPCWSPRSGDTCLKFVYDEPGSWVGVVWQHPANDWGDQPGGFDMTGAEKLTFWARGEIDLKDQDLTRVKTPFYWSMGGRGRPVTIWFDDIRFE